MTGKERAGDVSLLRKSSGKNWAWTSVDRLLKKINFIGVIERPNDSGRPRSVRTSEFSENIELVEELICSHESALHIYKNRYGIARKMNISRSSVRRIAKHDLLLKICNRLSGLLSFARWRHFIFQSCF